MANMVHEKSGTSVDARNRLKELLKYPIITLNFQGIAISNV